jgi:hypothetical protein
MKLALSLLFGLSLTTSVLTVGKVQEHELPATIRLKLDERYPGWRFAQISDEIRRATKEWASPASQLNLISGDFDGNGEVDYALLIEHGGMPNDEGATVGRSVNIVAFLRRGAKYKFSLVDSSGGDYLLLGRKGDGRYDYEARKKFTFTNDAIESVTFEKAATSYVYEGGKFRSILTGD